VMATTSGGLALRVDGLSAGYGPVTVLRDVGLSLDAGEAFALLGRNGMGKTTLLKAIVGLLPVVSGQVHIGGVDVKRLRTHHIARRSVSYVAQEQGLFNDLTVGENLRLAGGDPDDPGRRSVLELFPFIPRRLRQPAGSLSGGEQKMLLIARALMNRPGLLIVDEISEGLQPTIRQTVVDAFNRQREATGMTILLVEQNTQFAFSVVDRFALLKRGQIVETGRVADPRSLGRVASELSMGTQA
jgi:ABC-type branched-subunit amino acid transport system ATPase component